MGEKSIKNKTVKIEEWSNKFNPFNSDKNLVHSAHYFAILKRKILPPININFDMTNICNYNCRFCIFANRKRTDPTGETFRDASSLTSKYILSLPKIWKEWGAKAVCIGGGGDPTCHPACRDMLPECKKQGLDVGFVSNGFLCNDSSWWNAINKNCKFVGFSIDAGNKKDYTKTKGVPGDQFNVVINNMKEIAKVKKRMGSKLNIGFKFLIDDKNYKSIYQAIKIASEIGCNTIHIRPAISPTQIKLFKEHGNEIWNQVRRGRKFERDNFKVMGVTHKFNPDMSKKHEFGKCRASMLTSTWCADGKVYMCTDTRGNPWAYLSDHYPNPKKFIKYWGSKDHWNKVDRISLKKCDRCTLSPQNEYFEHVFINDEMEINLI